MKALAPGFLIAMPQLNDSNFERAVVLMVEHNAEGSMGLIINRPTEVKLEELALSQALSVAPERGEQLLLSGGPVEPFRGFVLHDSSTIGERTELLPGLFLSVTSEVLGPLLTDASVTLRFCLGYAGWGPGQVEKEIAEGSWLFTEATKADVLREEPEHIWAEVIKSMGVDPAMLVTTGGIN